MGQSLASIGRPWVINAAELAETVGVTEEQLQAFAQRSRLPFWVSAEHGLYIEACDLPAWRCVARQHLKPSPLPHPRPRRRRHNFGVKT